MVTTTCGRRITEMSTFSLPFVSDLRAMVVVGITAGRCECVSWLTLELFAGKLLQAAAAAAAERQQMRSQCESLETERKEHLCCALACFDLI